MIDPNGATAGTEGEPVGDRPSGLVLRVVERIAKIIVGLAILSVLVFTLGQVLDRHFLKGAFNAYDQMARIGLVWMTFVGAAMAMRQRRNIVVDLIDHYLPPRIVAAKALILDTLTLAIVGLMVSYALRLMDIGGYQRVIGTPFTYWTVYTSLFVGSLLFAIVLLARIVSTVLRLRRGADGDPAP